MPTARIYAGQKFGRLTATSDTGKSNRHGDHLWLFQCECGNMVERSAFNVTRSAAIGNIPACRLCATEHKRQFNSKDYTGMIFGKLTAVSYVGKSTITNRSMWLFVCDCGAKVERIVENLQKSVRDGNTPSCPGCREYPDGTANLRPPKRVDIAGQTFGNLTAVEPTGEVNERRYAVWLFQCKCGDVVEKSAGDVISAAKQGWTPSCGKSACNGFPKLPEAGAALNRLIGVYRKNAEMRGLEFTLERDEIITLFQGRCHYCGAPPSQIAKPTKGSGTPGYIYNGIDRMDNSQGYVPGNVVSCCWYCNRAKGKFSHDEFISWLRRAASYQFGVDLEAL